MTSVSLFKQSVAIYNRKPLTLILHPLLTIDTDATGMYGLTLLDIANDRRYKDIVDYLETRQKLSPRQPGKL